ncbi:MAG: MFS transporter [Oscillospiraceae bacterium]|nr:MFS transporter [Oscillospiraceae bacterium]
MMEQSREVRFFQAVQFLTYWAVGLWSYYILYLRNLGFGSREIGLLNAVGTGVTLVALPVLGVISDKIRSPRKMLAVCLIFAALLFPAVPLLGVAAGRSLWLFTTLTAVMLIFRKPIPTLLDSWSGAEMNRLDVNYGMIRLYGSIGFTAISVPAGFLIGSALPDWAGCACMPLMVIPVLALMLGRRGRACEAAPREKQERSIRTRELLRCVLRNYYFLSYLLLVLAIGFFLAVTEVYYSYIMDGAGVSRVYIGLVSGIRALWEVAVMLLVAKIRRRPPSWLLLTLSGLMIGAEHLLYHSGTGLPFILLAVFFTGVGGGIYYGTGNSYLFRIVDTRAATTALSLAGFLMSGIYIGVSAAGGAVIERYGVTVVTDGLAAIVILLTALFAAATAFGRYVLKLPYQCEKFVMDDGTVRVVKTSS